MRPTRAVNSSLCPVFKLDNCQRLVYGSPLLRPHLARLGVCDRLACFTISRQRSGFIQPELLV